VQSLRPPYVNDVSFELRAGEIVGLAGLLGSGRSEVARAIFAADRALSGSVEVAGAELRARSPRQAINHGVVMLPEDRKGQGLLMLRTLVENITLPHLADVSRAGVMESRVESRRAGELLSRLDVRTKSPRARVNTLSGGNQQKILFAKWLFRTPHVFIADEPTRGVDVGAKRAIYEFLHFSGRTGDRRAADLIRARGGARACAPRSRHAGRADRGQVHGRDDERKCSAERRVRDAAGRGD
jgi:ABC-type sugar transport system ATPase subunit